MIIIRKHREVYSKCYEDEPNDSWTSSESFKSKVKITENTLSDVNTKDVATILALKYLSDF